MNPWLILSALGVVGAAAFTLRPRTAAAKSSSSDGGGSSTGGGGGAPIGPDALSKLFERAEIAAKWPGLATFLLAASWTESTWHPDARSPSGAIGLFQLKPASARIAELGLPPSVLTDPAWATALYLWYLARMRNYAAPGQVIDWLALRRGGAYPVLVADVHESFTAEQSGAKGATGQRSAEVRGRFELALAHTGVPTSFENQPAFPAGWTWPGLPAIVTALGLSTTGSTKK